MRLGEGFPIISSSDDDDAMASVGQCDRANGDEGFWTSLVEHPQTSSGGSVDVFEQVLAICVGRDPMIT